MGWKCHLPSFKGNTSAAGTQRALQGGPSHCHHPWKREIPTHTFCWSQVVMNLLEKQTATKKQKAGSQFSTHVSWSSVLSALNIKPIHSSWEMNESSRTSLLVLIPMAIPERWPVQSTSSQDGVPSCQSSQLSWCCRPPLRRPTPCHSRQARSWQARWPAPQDSLRLSFLLLASCTI